MMNFKLKLGDKLISKKKIFRQKSVEYQFTFDLQFINITRRKLCKYFNAQTNSLAQKKDTRIIDRTFIYKWHTYLCQAFYLIILFNLIFVVFHHSRSLICYKYIPNHARHIFAMQTYIH